MVCVVECRLPPRPTRFALPTGRKSSLLEAGGSASKLLNPERIWEHSVETELDSRAAIFDEAGVVVTFSDLLTVDDGDLYALNVENGDQLWKRPIDYPPSIRFHEGVMYHHNDDTLAALNPQSGAKQWTISGEFWHPSVYEGEYAAFTSEFGEATIVDLADGEIAWKPERRTLTTPVSLVDGDLVLRGDGELAGYDVETGEESWRYTDVPPGGSNVTVRSAWPYCFVTSEDPAETLALDLRDGTPRWRKEGSTYPRRFVPGDSDGGILLATDIGTVTGLEPASGEERWSRSLTENLIFLPIVDDQLAVFVAEDHVWAVSVEDGSILWDHSMDTPFPMVHEVNDTFYAADTGIQTFARDGTQTGKADFTGEQSLSPDTNDTRLVVTSGSTVYGFSIEPEPDQTETTAEDPTETSSEDPTETTAEGSTETTFQGPTETTDAPTPGFGAVSAIVALLALVAEYLRRNDDSGSE